MDLFLFGLSVVDVHLSLLMMLNRYECIEVAYIWWIAWGGTGALAALSIPFISSTHKRITRSMLQPEESSNKIVSREIGKYLADKVSPRRGE